MVNLAKAVQFEGFDADDYAEIPFTNVEVAYVVGTNAYASDPTSCPAVNKDTGVPGFMAHNTLLYATQNCYVRFNGASRVQHLLFANTYYQFRRKIMALSVVRQNINGVLYAWFEG
jgi:hypothetical protein